LVVATRGDVGSVGALHLASQLAKRDSATVVALGVVPPVPRRAVSLVVPAIRDAEQEGRLEMLKAVRGRVKRIPGADEWMKRAVIAMPDTAIPKIALETKAALLLIGLSHPGRLDRLFSGETTIARKGAWIGFSWAASRTTVIRGAQCSVLIAPPQMAVRSDRTT
jgi:nucleotide-binding universal stress UspA family protein